jgi:hypothetical protein
MIVNKINTLSFEKEKKECEKIHALHTHTQTNKQTNTKTKHIYFEFILSTKDIEDFKSKKRYPILFG